MTHPYETYVKEAAGGKADAVVNKARSLVTQSRAVKKMLESVCRHAHNDNAKALE